MPILFEDVSGTRVSRHLRTLCAFVVERDEEKKGIGPALATISMCSHDFVLGYAFKNRLSVLTRVQFISNFNDHPMSHAMYVHIRSARGRVETIKEETIWLEYFFYFDSR